MRALLDARRRSEKDDALEPGVLEMSRRRPPSIPPSTPRSSSTRRRRRRERGHRRLDRRAAGDAVEVPPKARKAPSANELARRAAEKEAAEAATALFDDELKAKAAKAAAANPYAMRRKNKKVKGPLWAAAVTGDLDAVKRYLASGVHNALEQSPPGWKMTPCMAAAAGGHVDVVRALLDAKANADAIDASTNLAIDWARHEEAGRARRAPSRLDAQHSRRAIARPSSP